MPRYDAASQVANRIQNLLEQREQHQKAIAEIDQTLERIGSLLGGRGGRNGRRRGPGRPPRTTTETVTYGGGRRRRKRQRFAVSGEQSIINFVRQHRNPTTSDITAHWRSEGRGGKADNALSRLVKARELKRQAVPGERGSRYLIA